MATEPQVTDPYEAVLADLRAKRDQLDQTINAIEAARSGLATTGIIPAAAANTLVNGPGSLLGYSIVDAAKKLLAEQRKPLRNPEFANLFKEGGLVLNSKDSANTIGSVMTRRFEEFGDVVKVGRGTWGLKEWYPNRSFGKKEKAETKRQTTAPLKPSKPKLVVAKE